MPQMEIVLNQPLNGAEVREIIMAKIKETLDLDTRLHEMMAFPSFRFTADIAIVLTGAVHSEVSRTVEGGVGDVNADPSEPAMHVVAHAEAMEMPPNQARVEAGIGVPVLTRDEKGRPVERLVKYDKERGTTGGTTGGTTDGATGGVTGGSAESF
jgi:hypothetical protein